MKRLLILCAGITSLLALATAQADAPAQGTATTGVNLEIALTSDEHVSFTVQDYGPDLQDRGNFSYHNFITGVHYNVNPSCIEVSGNRARFAFVIPSEEGPLFAGTARVVEVVDNGEPSAGPSPDLYGDTPGGPGQSITNACNFVNTLPFGALLYNKPVTAGNIQVHN